MGSLPMLKLQNCKFPNEYFSGTTLDDYAITVSSSNNIYIGLENTDNYIKINPDNTHINNRAAISHISIGGGFIKNTSNTTIEYESGSSMHRFFVNNSESLTVEETRIVSKPTFTYSDDRLKDNEVFIENATQTLQKLRPQLYDKKTSFDTNKFAKRESGLIAQEIYYDAPELRHIINIADDANLDGIIKSSDDPSKDPDYTNWGTYPASVNYTELIPYIIKSIQEKDNEIKELRQTLSNVLEQIKN